MAPMVAATRHMRCGELNSMENPHTPTKAATKRRQLFSSGSSPSGSKPPGFRCTTNAVIQPANVAIRMIANV